MELVQFLEGFSWSFPKSEAYSSCYFKIMLILKEEIFQTTIFFTTIKNIDCWITSVVIDMFHFQLKHLTFNELNQHSNGIH